MPGRRSLLAVAVVLVGIALAPSAVWGDGGGTTIEVETIAVVLGPTRITIDIKPGSFPNSINLNCRGNVPVAILTTNDFDAATVNPITVVFAGASPVRWALMDVDRDGDLDLLLHFRCRELSFNANTTELCLQALTFDGQQVEGCDSVRIVPPSNAGPRTGSWPLGSTISGLTGQSGTNAADGEAIDSGSLREQPLTVDSRWIGWAKAASRAVWQAARRPEFPSASIGGPVLAAILGVAVALRRSNGGGGR